MTLDRPPEKVADSAPRPSPRVATAGDPPNAERRWTAEIVWDRAAGAAAFRAVARGDGESGQEVVVESPRGVAAEREFGGRGHARRR